MEASAYQFPQPLAPHLAILIAKYNDDFNDPCHEESQDCLHAGNVIQIISSVHSKSTDERIALWTHNRGDETFCSFGQLPHNLDQQEMLEFCAGGCLVDYSNIKQTAKTLASQITAICNILSDKPQYYPILD